MHKVTFKSEPVELSGSFPRVGDHAPDFSLTTLDLGDVTLADFAGKRKLLNIVPSLDTSVCAKSIQVFDERVGSIDNLATLVVSADLPFAQQRFAETHGIRNITFLSLMHERQFARDYGVCIASGPLRGLCTRAVVVLDEDNIVRHAQLVPEIAQEPDYDAALAVL
ncbi:thiol peroxidase (atypical 2-Cys peroxiredoxin) [Sulfurivirga caldicuralii]|uniref:Thiol peroxidase (Atypical 2-Cys peroxiredoxin) n=1 Tax=Sulfurivirga caldicuralii TaxID=364032 RepID=A0A1N6DPN9_9GAMM|nr:thiol peroxidase [Sulfurivirga caldicuralii]SIN72716.1 thiol peroxidase (atypical 2-Cys peroxiredoxin) [Sulfurivirga caldicuralii]